MSPIAKVKICWISPEAGGRKAPPMGTRYSTVASFDDASSTPLQATWSLVVEFLAPIDASLCGLANVWFLSSEAPLHWLAPGKRFTLFEGKRRVATGEVLKQPQSLPMHNGVDVATTKTQPTRPIVSEKT